MLFDLKIFSGGVYPPSATSRTISFFYFKIVFGINFEYISGGIKLTLFIFKSPGEEPPFTESSKSQRCRIVQLWVIMNMN